MQTQLTEEQHKKGLDIVIDFDGTLVTHEFPLIGQDIGAVPVLKEIVDNGHRLVLFTMRSDRKEGHYLAHAVKWFKDNEIPLYGIQKNPTQDSWTKSPKAFGQIIIDDAALGCPLVYNKHARPFVDWQIVRLMLQKMQVLKNAI